MTLWERVFDNAKILLLTEVLNVVAGVATVIVLARLVDVSALGLYSLSYSLGAVFAIICLYGANQFLTREIARHPENLEFWLGNSLAVRLGIALSLFMVCGVFFIALDYGRVRILIALLLILNRVLESLLLMFCAIFRGYQEMRYEGLLRSALSAASLLVGLSVLVLSRSLLSFAVVQVVSTALVVFAAYRLVIGRYHVVPMRSVAPAACMKVFRDGLSFSAYSILLVLFVQTNTIMLSLFKGDLDTGLYTAGFRFVSALGMGAASITGALYPAVSQLNIQDHADEIRLIYLRCTKVLWILASFFSTTLFVFSDEIVYVVYGAGYAPAAAGVRIMAFSLFFSYANVSSTNLLFCLDQESTALRILGSGTLFVFIINLVMIPLLGYFGASWTTLIPEVFVLILLASALRKILGRIGTLTLFVKFVGLGVLVCGSALFLHSSPLLVRVAAFLAAHVAALMAMSIASPWTAIDMLRRKAGALEAADARS
ncbi:MAG: flippase [Elusimicrobiota bacterium]